MTCPDNLDVHYVIVMWLFDVGQIATILLTWEGLRLLWRMAKYVESPKIKQ